MRKSRVLKFLPDGWYSRLSPEEIDQEECMILWKTPELEGYEGLFAFGRLMYSAYCDSKTRCPSQGRPVSSLAKPCHSMQESIYKPLSPLLKTLTSFERYCLSLVYDMGVTDAAKYLDELPGPLDQMLLRIRNKLKDSKV